MEDEHFSNDNVVIIKQDDDYKNKPTTELVKKMTKIDKDNAFDAFKFLCKKVQNEKGCSISCIRSDHGEEFENHRFENFCNDFGIEHQFSSPRTPQ